MCVPVSTVAMPPPLTDHIPPAVASEKTADAPTHTDALPMTMPGTGLVVKTMDAEHPPTVYRIVEAPLLTAPTTPSGVTVAEVSELLHTPPPKALDRLAVVPAQAEAGPLMADGAVLTVSGRVAEQPVPRVYVILVPPADRPDTVRGIPPLRAATDVSATDQVPPGVTVLSVVELPSHTVPVPVMAAGTGFTVNGSVAEQLPSVYLTTVLPARVAERTPSADIVTTLEGDELHVPPITAFASVVAVPTQAVPTPLIAEGIILTTNERLAEQPVPSV